MKVSVKQIDVARTSRGGFLFDQIKVAYKFMGRDWRGQPEKGWLQDFVSRDIPEDVWQEFLFAGSD